MMFLVFIAQNTLNQTNLVEKIVTNFFLEKLVWFEKKYPKTAFFKKLQKIFKVFPNDF
jgi:hypothetical protein